MEEKNLRRKVLHYRTSGETEPIPENIELGEIAVSTHNQKPCLFIKKDDDTIARIMDKVYVDNCIDGIINRIVQTSGKSINDIMSQSAVTYELTQRLPATGGTITGDLLLTKSLTNYSSLKTYSSITCGRANSNVATRFYMYRLNTYNNKTYVSQNTIGYNPKVGTVNTDDYGMKFAVFAFNNPNVEYPTLSETQMVASFYLSHTGCYIGYSNSLTKQVTQFYDVLHSGNAYKKSEIDELLNERDNRISELEDRVKALEEKIQQLEDKLV